MKYLALVLLLNCFFSHSLFSATFNHEILFSFNDPTNHRWYLGSVNSRAGHSINLYSSMPIWDCKIILENEDLAKVKGWLSERIVNYSKPELSKGIINYITNKCWHGKEIHELIEKQHLKERNRNDYDGILSLLPSSRFYLIDGIGFSRNILSIIHEKEKESSSLTVTLETLRLRVDFFDKLQNVNLLSTKTGEDPSNKNPNNIASVFADYHQDPYSTHLSNKDFLNFKELLFSSKVKLQKEVKKITSFEPLNLKANTSRYLFAE